MQIYYFTRSGRSKTIAEQLAARYGVQAEQISDEKSWEGALGYMKAGYMSVTGKSLPITYKQPAPGEQLAVVFPIWAGTFPPAVKAFVEQVGREQMICIPTSMGSKLKDREGFVKVIDLVGDQITAPETL